MFKDNTGYDKLKNKLSVLTLFRKFIFKRDKKIIRKKKFENIKFDVLKATKTFHKPTEATIDDTTWNDLDMDNIFCNINHSVCSAGEETLYNWLKNPVDNNEKLIEREANIKEFEENNKEMENFRLKISEIGHCKFNIKEAVNNDFLVNYKLLVLFIILALINIGLIICTLASVFNLAFIFLLLSSGMTMTCHYLFLEKYESQLEVLRYIIKMVSTMKKNIKLLKIISPKYYEKSIYFNNMLKKVAKYQTSFFRIEGLDILADYLNIVFLIKEINFLIVSRQVNKMKDEIIKYYDIIGEIDALMSIVEYRKELDYYCNPIIYELNNEIKVEDVYHPLLDKPVSNSIDIKNSVAITGSNMSGKSTFLRTLSINAILAQSICTSLSNNYQSGFYRVVTSISLSDDILQGKSYFLMESEAIHRMIELKDSELPLLICIDEIFKGTNPIERLAASTEILNILSASNTKTIVATHDLQILPELKQYDFYYFTENVTKQRLDFDYKLYSGISSTRNAIKLLEYIKYPEDVIDKINKRIKVLEL